MGKGEEVEQIHKIRISLSSRNPKALEKVCADLMLRAKDQKIKTRGPVRLPTRELKLTVRKSPCGNGSASRDTFRMRIYKRLIDIYPPRRSSSRSPRSTSSPGLTSTSPSTTCKWFCNSGAPFRAPEQRAIAGIAIQPTAGFLHS